MVELALPSLLSLPSHRTPLLPLPSPLLLTSHSLFPPSLLLAGWWSSPWWPLGAKVRRLSLVGRRRGVPERRRSLAGMAGLSAWPGGAEARGGERRGRGRLASGGGRPDPVPLHLLPCHQAWIGLQQPLSGGSVRGGGTDRAAAAVDPVAAGSDPVVWIERRATAGRATACMGPRQLGATAATSSKGDQGVPAADRR